MASSSNELEGGESMARLELWQCTICGYTYDPARGDPEAGIKPQTPFTQLPPDWACPDCGAGLTDFALYR